MNWILRIVGGFLLFTVAIFLFGYVTMYLWNWLMPDLFHLPVIDFAHALGLVVLSKILFGGMRVKHGASAWGQRRFWKAKWESMTDEERSKFKNEFAERCRSKWGRVEMKIEKEA
jgi:hypothetical protein